MNTLACKQSSNESTSIAKALVRSDLKAKVEERACLHVVLAAWKGYMLRFSEAGLQTSVGLSFGRALMGMPDLSVGPYAETGMNHLELRVHNGVHVNAGRSAGTDLSGPYTELYVELARQHSRSGLCVGCDLAGPFVNVYISSAKDTRGGSDEIGGVSMQDLTDAAVLARDSADLLLSSVGTHPSHPSEPSEEVGAPPEVEPPAAPLARACKRLSTSLGSEVGFLQHLAMPQRGPIVASDWNSSSSASPAVG